MTACPVFCRPISRAVLVPGLFEGAIDQSAVDPGRHPLNFRFSLVLKTTRLLRQVKSDYITRLNPASPWGTSTSSPVAALNLPLDCVVPPCNRVNGLSCSVRDSQFPYLQKRAMRYSAPRTTAPEQQTSGIQLLGHRITGVWRIVNYSDVNLLCWCVRVLLDQ